MITTIEKLEGLVNHLKEYVATTIALLKMRAAEKVSAVAADTAALVISLVAICFFLVFASLGLSIYIGVRIGSPVGGFLIVSAIYLIIAIIGWTQREAIIRRRILNHMVKRLFENENSNETNG